MQSEENEELQIMKGIRELFRFLPDEKIYLEIMEIGEKRKLLEEIRNDDNMTYIRENFFMYDWQGGKKWTLLLIFLGGLQ